ncbi:MAG: cell division protein ZipA [Tatlockia sp.]|nr:cell division protein ZipA [Tatlockia sp.]
MQTNWSLILNVLLLIGVIIAISRLMKARRQSLTPESPQPILGQPEKQFFDDIISVRKIDSDLPEEKPSEKILISTSSNKVLPISAKTELEKKEVCAGKAKTLMMFLLAKENRQLAGYELLQTILAAGLRFGEGNLFHRHQHTTGQGPILCSLAAATASGVFDLHNIGAFSVRGLCLFMQVSGNSTIDNERFHIMYETAKQLSEGLDTYLLDECKKPLTEQSLMHYREALDVDSVAAAFA